MPKTLFKAYLPPLYVMQTCSAGFCDESHSSWPRRATFLDERLAPSFVFLEIEESFLLRGNFQKNQPCTLAAVLSLFHLFLLETWLIHRPLAVCPTYLGEKTIVGW